MGENFNSGVDIIVGGLYGMAIAAPQTREGDERKREIQGLEPDRSSEMIFTGYRFSTMV